jgi:hypothetical protein
LHRLLCGIVLGFLGSLLAGCLRPVATIDTGAREVALQYGEALCRADWPRASQCLHADSSRRWSASEFARLCDQYRKDMGFEPTEFHLRSCEEQGEEAIAHLTFTGLAGGHQKFYKETLSLRRCDSGWGVVLPVKFGRQRSR